VFYHGDLGAELEALKLKRAKKAKEAREKANIKAKADREKKRRRRAAKIARRLAANATSKPN